MKWYKRDPDAWLASTRCLTLEERGAYNDILEMLYSRDGDLPDDDRRIARNLGCRPQVWRRIKMSLLAAGKIHQTGTKLTANRVETTLKEASYFSQTQKIKAGLRWKTQQNQRPDDAKTAMPKQPQPQPHPQEERKNAREERALPPLEASQESKRECDEGSKAESKQEKRGAHTSEFVVFWALYPNKVGRKAADKAFAAALRAVSFEALMAGLERYVHKADDRPWCNPTTWLNQGRWEDQPAAAQHNGSNGNGRGRSVLEAADRLINSLGGREAAERYVPGSSGPRPLDLDQFARSRGLKLISKG